MHIPHFLLLAIMLDFSGCNLSLSLSFTHTHLYHHHHHHRKWLVAICLLFYGIIVGMLLLSTAISLDKVVEKLNL